MKVRCAHGAGDVAYYSAGCAGALLAGGVPAARRARLPILALLAANWAGEQRLLAALQRHLEVDASSGAVYASLIEPRWLATLRARLRQALRGRATQMSLAEVPKLLLLLEQCYYELCLPEQPLWD